MALIDCPECGRKISDKAVSCPNCGLPAKYFVIQSNNNEVKNATSSNKTSSKEPQKVDLQNVGNILVSFDKDYVVMFNPNHYISKREKKKLKEPKGFDEFVARTQKPTIEQVVKTLDKEPAEQEISEEERGK